MTIVDNIKARGQVVPSFVNLKTGERIPWDQRHNTLSFDASRAVALAFGGDDSLIPNRIGIIYGNSDTTTFLTTISRQQSWDSLVYELKDKNADMQVQPFCYSPSFTQVERSSGSDSSGSGSETDSGSSGGATYPGWAVTFHAHSDSVTPGVVGADEGSSGMIFTTGNYIYQAVLLNEKAGKYTILARVSLDSSGTYYAKPENFEVALDWTVKFF